MFPLVHSNSVLSGFAQKQHTRDNGYIEIPDASRRGDHGVKAVLIRINMTIQTRADNH